MKNSESAPLRRQIVPWAVTITLAGFVTGAGFAAAATMSGGTAASAGKTATSSTATSSTATNGGATSSTATSSTATNGGATSSADVTTLLSASNNAKAAPGLRGLRRAGGMYGSITYLGKDGHDRTLAFERGTVTSVSGDELVVRAPDGTTMTWLLTSTTVVREQRAKTTTSALRADERVFVGGPIVSGAKDARLIVIRTSTGMTS